MRKIIKNVLPYGLVKKYERRNQKNQIQNKNIYEEVNQREFYNALGEKVYTFFLKDSLAEHQPWGFVYGRTPQTVLWDRTHPGLPTHFYTHEHILRTIGCPRKKFAYLVESETIVPNDYQTILNNPDLVSEFELVFTHSEKILNRFSNARYLPPSGVWYANELSNNLLDSRRFEKKKKLVSIVASNKQMCDLHKYRSSIAKELKVRSLADCYGTFDGGARVDYIDETLNDYMFQVVIENEVSEYYFTEKILNCFASMTIPIYIGARNIGEFFNEDGIIFANDMELDSLIQLVEKCDLKMYEERVAAVIDNYKRVQDFLCIEDYLTKYYAEYLE